MLYLNLDYSIVYIFLLVTLVIGVLAGKGTKTIQEYAIGNRRYGTAALVMTYLATDIGAGSILSDAASIFSRGIIVNVSIASLAIAYVVRAIFIVPKMVYFNNCLTMGEVMGMLYGRFARVITGFLSVLNATILAGIQLIALGIISEYLLGIKAIWGTLMGGFIVSLYAAIGGIKAITVTDVVQFFILIVAVPLIAYIAVYHVGGMKELFLKIPSEKLVILSHDRFYRYLLYFIIWFLQVGMIDPFVVQQMLMAKSKRQLRNQYLTVAAFDPIFRFIVALIALAGLALYPSIEAKNVVLHIIQKLLPVGVKGLAIVGLLAIVMSSADSYIHVAGLTFVHDMISPFYNKRESNTCSELYWVRYVTIFVGIVATMIGIKMVTISYWGFKALEVIAPMLLFPFISGVVGLKPDKRVLITALSVTLIAFVASNLLLPVLYSQLSIMHDQLSILISIMANGFTFFGLHYILHKGFKTVERRIIKPITDFHPASNRSLFAIFKRSSVRKILCYAQDRVQQYGAPYILSGVFCLINLIAPYFISQQVTGKNQALLLSLRFIGIIFCFFLIVKDKWRQSLQNKYLPAFFYFTLFYCLPFLSTIMMLATQGDIAWLIHMLLSLIFLMVLVDWFSMILLSILGIALGLLFIGHFNPLNWGFHVTSGALIVYQISMTLLIGLIFARNKQKQVDHLATQKQQLVHVQTLSESERLYSLRNQLQQKEVLVDQGEPLQNVKRILNILAEKGVKDRSAIQETIEQLDSFITCYKNNFYQSIDYLRLNVESIELDKLLSKVATSLPTLGLEKKVQIQFATQHSRICCDSDKIVQLLVSNLYRFHLKETYDPLILSIQDTMLSYQFQAIPGYTRKIPALGFVFTTEYQPFALQPFYPGNTTDEFKISVQNILDWVQLHNKCILNAHYGYSAVIETDVGQRMFYVVPVDLRAIRSKVVDQIQLAGQGLLETSASLDVEKAFLAQLQEKTTIDLEVIQVVITQIKHLHQGQFRKSGELFYTHPLSVASLLLSMTQNQNAIIAALLHDTVEDTPLNLDQVTYQYGQEVAYIVGKVTCLDATRKKTQLTEAENHQQLAAYHDPRVVMVKLADRLHNVRTLEFHPLAKQHRIAQETLVFYVPLGRKLRLYTVDQVVNEIEARCQATINAQNTNTTIVNV